MRSTSSSSATETRADSDASIDWSAYANVVCAGNVSSDSTDIATDDAASRRTRWTHAPTARRAATSASLGASRCNESASSCAGAAVSGAHPSANTNGTQPSAE